MLNFIKNIINSYIITKKRNILQLQYMNELINDVQDQSKYIHHLGMTRSSNAETDDIERSKFKQAEVELAELRRRCDDYKNAHNFHF